MIRNLIRELAVLPLIHFVFVSMNRTANWLTSAKPLPVHNGAQENGTLRHRFARPRPAGLPPTQIAFPPHGFVPQNGAHSPTISPAIFKNPAFASPVRDARPACAPNAKAPFRPNGFVPQTARTCRPSHQRFSKTGHLRHRFARPDRPCAPQRENAFPSQRVCSAKTARTCRPSHQRFSKTGHLRHPIREARPACAPQRENAFPSQRVCSAKRRALADHLTSDFQKPGICVTGSQPRPACAPPTRKRPSVPTGLFRKTARTRRPSHQRFSKTGHLRHPFARPDRFPLPNAKTPFRPNGFVPQKRRAPADHLTSDLQNSGICVIDSQGPGRPASLQRESAFPSQRLCSAKRARTRRPSHQRFSKTGHLRHRFARPDRLPFPQRENAFPSQRLCSAKRRAPADHLTSDFQKPGICVIRQNPHRLRSAKKRVAPSEHGLAPRLRVHRATSCSGPTRPDGCGWT